MAFVELECALIQIGAGEAVSHEGRIADAIVASGGIHAGGTLRAIVGARLALVHVRAGESVSGPTGQAGAGVPVLQVLAFGVFVAFVDVLGALVDVDKMRTSTRFLGSLVIPQVVLVATPQAPVLALAPAPNAAIRQQRAVVVGARRQLHDGSAHWHIAGTCGCLIVADRARVAVAEHAPLSAAPAANPTPGQQCACVVRTRHQLGRGSP